MHDCQRFREDWIAGLAEDVGDCEPCRTFCEDARLLLQAVDGATPPLPELSEPYWDRFDDRLRWGLVQENAARRHQLYWKWSMAAAVAALAVVLSWGAMRMSLPLMETAKAAPQIEFVDDHIKDLNPTVVAFLGQSELFLRSFTKIDPSYQEDLQEAQSRAKQALTEIEKQKVRAADFAPVRIALDEYENFLRDIKNVDSDGVSDIQTRIRKSGLIANMKAYQPQVILVTGGRRQL